MTAHRKNVALILVAAALLPWATSEAMPRWLPESTSLTLCIGVALAMLGLSLNLLLGYAGQLSLGHAALMGTGAFAGSVVVDRWEAPMFLAWAFAAVAGGVIALGIGLPALRLRGLYLAIVTIAFGITLQSSVLRWNIFTHGSAGAALPRRLWGETMVNDAAVYLSMGLVLLVAVWLVDRNVMRTRLGRAFRMIREDEVTAASFGIDVTRYKLAAFVLSGAIAGLAGAYYGGTLGLVNSDSFDLQQSLRAVLIVMIGGLGRRWGIGTVAVLLALSPKLPEWFRGWDLVVAAFVTAYNVVRLPGGLAGLIDHLRPHHLPEEEDDPPIPNFLVRESSGGTLRVEEVTVRFGGLLAVDDVSLEVPAGSIVGVIGPNGAGKSTLFNAISGLLPDARGRVFLDGEALHELPPHGRALAGLGRTFQNVGLAVDMSVRENILLARHADAAYGDAGALLYTARVNAIEGALAADAERAIEQLGFNRYADVPVRTLSGGQRRLVELAAVLATGPKLLMLDEPTAGLSPAAAENLADRLRELRDNHGQTILLIEHNVPMVLDLCDHVYVLNAGALLADGKPRALARNPEVLGAYLGEHA